eukprot:3046798-Prymnesium_polylepis.1
MFRYPRPSKVAKTPRVLQQRRLGRLAAPVAMAAFERRPINKRRASFADIAAVTVQVMEQDDPKEDRLRCCKGVSTKHEMQLVVERFGEHSVHATILRVLQMDIVQNSLISILIIDLIVTLAGLLLKEQYPDCTVVMRDVMGCVGEGHTEPEPAVLCTGETLVFNDDHTSACNPDKYPGVKAVEIALWTMSLSILSCFMLELVLLLLVLRGAFFRSFFYVLDVAIVFTSFVLEAMFGDPNSKSDSGSALGLLLFARLWRLLRLASR